MLYSLRYPKLDLEAIDKISNGAFTEKLEKQSRESAARFDKMINNGTYSPIPGRDVSKHRFIELAKRFSEDFCVDLDIIENDICITADFYFETIGIFTHLISAMIMADEIVIIPETFEERAILGLIYNTHSLVNG